MATWGEFAQSLLTELGVPVTDDNVNALLGWFAGEQPPDNPNAQFNPLNIQAGDFPHDGTSGSGQYNFPTYDEGVAQTAAFLRQSYYVGIVAALQAGGSCYDVLAAVQESPWAAGHYGYALTGQCAAVNANRDRYMAGQIAGEGGPTVAPPPPVTGGPKPPTRKGCQAPFTF